MARTRANAAQENAPPSPRSQRKPEASIETKPKSRSRQRHHAPDQQPETDARVTPAPRPRLHAPEEPAPDFSAPGPADARVWVGDCREILPRLDDVRRSQVDLVFADPPFNWNRAYDKWDDAITWRPNGSKGSNIVKVRLDSLTKVPYWRMVATRVYTEHSSFEFEVGEKREIERTNHRKREKRRGSSFFLLRYK